MSASAKEYLGRPEEFWRVRRKRKISKGVLVFIVILAVIVIAFAFMIWQSMSHATLTVRVSAGYPHLPGESVAYEMSINGELRARGTVVAFNYDELKFDMTPGASCTNYTVSAIGSGPGGTFANSQNVRLCPGDTKKITIGI